MEFESGKRAVAVKNVTLAEDCLTHHFPDFPIFPASLMIEGMAQTAGILVGEARKFSENVILAKIRVADFEDYAVPGDQLLYEARLDALDERGGVTSGIVRKGDREIGRVDLIFSHVGSSAGTHGLPEHNFVFTEQFLALLEAFRRN